MEPTWFHCWHYLRTFVAQKLAECHAREIEANPKGDQICSFRCRYLSQAPIEIVCYVDYHRHDEYEYWYHYGCCEEIHDPVSAVEEFVESCAEITRHNAIQS